MASEFKAEPIANSLPSDHLTWRPVTVLQPSFKVTHAYTVFDLGFLDSHRDNGIRCNMTNPFAGPEDFEALSDRIVKTFCRDADSVLNVLGVTADDFAAFDRQLVAIQSKGRSGLKTRSDNEDL